MSLVLHDYLVDVHLWPPGEVEALRMLQFPAIRDLGITANQFTKQKNQLLRQGLLRPTAVKIGTQFPTQVLSKGKPDPKKLKNLTEVLHERAQVMRPERLGAAGEFYCRALFERLKHKGAPIHQITRKRALGYESVQGLPRREDLRFWYTDTQGWEYRVSIENRNRNENTYPTNGEYFATLLQKALRTDSQPALMASYLPPKSVDLCNQLGIAVYVYGRQFVDSRLKSAVKQLYPLHKEMFQFVYMPQPFANYPLIDKRSRDDLAALRDWSWIETAHDQWVHVKPWIPAIAEALAKNDLSTVDAFLLESYA